MLVGSKTRAVRLLYLHKFRQLPTLRPHGSTFGKRYLGRVYFLHRFHQQLPRFLGRGRLKTEVKYVLSSAMCSLPVRKTSYQVFSVSAHLPRGSLST